MKKRRGLIYLWILICVMALGLLFIKHPMQKVLVGSKFEKADYMQLKSNHLYEQKVLIKDDTVSKLMFVVDRKNNVKKKVNGDLIVTVYDNNHQEIFRQNYKIATLPTEQTTIYIPVTNQPKKGENYYLTFQLQNANNSDLTLLTVNDPIKYLDNNQQQNRSIAYYHDKEVVDKTSFWYPIYGLAIGVFLLLISGDQKNEK